MISLVVHAVLGLTVIGWIVASNPKTFARPAGARPFSALEWVYYLVGIASTALGWYFNVRFVHDYGTGTANPSMVFAFAFYFATIERQRRHARILNHPL